MNWSKEEKDISDIEFPHRVMIYQNNIRPFFVPSATVIDVLHPNSEIMMWLFSNFGPTIKPPSIMTRLFQRANVEIKKSLDATWMVKTQGRKGYKFFFRTSNAAVAFKLVFSENTKKNDI